MNIPRMQALSSYLLNTVDPRTFDMRIYWYNGNCGCTIGHAAHMPEFKLLGFDWDELMSFSVFIQNGLEIDMYPKIAFMKFMDLNPDQTEYITSGSLRLDPDEIAERIDWMIAKEQRWYPQSIIDTQQSKELTPA